MYIQRTAQVLAERAGTVLFGGARSEAAGPMNPTIQASAGLALALYAVTKARAIMG